MRIYREGTRIIIEVEEGDAPEGSDLEMVADAVMAGMKLFASEGIRQKIKPEYDRMGEKIKPEIEGVLEDFRERWEITR